MSELPSDLARLLERVAIHDDSAARRLTDVVTRLLGVADALTWAREALPRLAAAPDDSALLEVVVEITREVSQAPEVWAVAWEGDEGRLSFRALTGHSEQGVRTDDGELLTPEGLSRTLVGQALADGRPAWSDDARADGRFLTSDSVHALALRSVGCVPLGQRGILYLYDPDQPGRFGATVRARVSALGAVASALLDAHHTQVAPPSEAEPLPGVVGSTPPMQAVARSVRAFAPMPWPCLVLGETGTGKEAIATALHTLSPRSSRPFVPVNCGAIPESLAESTLFGHERGAFTGADRAKPGLISEVRGGTLFLDEVGELPGPVQVKLLRLLQEGTWTPVGGTRPQNFRGRVVAATHRHIDRDEGFRRDLYHRLSAGVIRVPALRDRRDDIPALVHHLFARSLDELGTDQLGLAPEAVDALSKRSWPGNVRELQNAVRTAIAQAMGRGSDRVHPQDLPGARVPGLDHDVDESLDLVTATTRFQQERVRQALEANDNNKTKAAEHLGVSRQWLHRLITRWDREGPW